MINVISELLNSCTKYLQAQIVNNSRLLEAVEGADLAFYGRS